MLRLRFAILSVLALIVPACGGDIRVPAPLLSDGFNGTFPGANWTVPAATGMGTSVQIAGGALEFSTTAATSSSTTTSTSDFANPNLTVAVQLGTVAAAGELGVGTIEILDATPAVVAFVSWDTAGAGMLTYSITGTALPPSTPPPADGTLSQVRFNVNAGGTASWSFNNAQVGTKAAFPAGPLKVRLGGSFGAGSAWPEFRFDNVTVTSP